MAFIPVPNTAMVEVVCTHLGEVCENVLYFEGAAPWDATSLLDLATDVVAWWVGEMKSIVTANTVLTTVKATSLESQSAPGVEYPVSPPQAGTLGDNAMPGNVTVATTFVTALRGRAYRGRNYFIGMSEGGVTGNAVDSGRRGQIENAYNDMATYVLANSATHVVVSRQLNNVPRVTGVATAVTAYRTEANVDSQRRRLAGRGQ